MNKSKSLAPKSNPIPITIINLVNPFLIADDNK